MSTRILTFNQPQLTSAIISPYGEVNVWGRGTGKSAGIAWIIYLLYKYMPRAVVAITGTSYTQLLTKTLVPTFDFLNRLGWIDGVHYVVGKRPPENWPRPYQMPFKFENYIFFNNGLALMLLSQDRQGASRGPSSDFEILDEALTINKPRYDEEVSATNRGNLDRYKTVKFHHGFKYVSSMPWTSKGKWLLDYGNYYMDERGIDLFKIWNEIVNLQLQMLDITDPKEFTSQWNEMVRIEKQIAPFTSKDGILFTLANAFDNINNVGLSYIKREHKKMPKLTFLIEIMNMIIDKVEDSYYNINDKNILYDTYREEYVKSIGIDRSLLSTLDSRADADCNPHDVLMIGVDWGARFSCLVVGQMNSNTIHMVNEFYVKPPGEMIDRLMQDFVDYYAHHRNKTIYYYRDRHGDNQQANSSITYNQQAINYLSANGWTVVEYVHKGQEPPQHEKYLLWNNITKETDPNFPIVTWNGNKCKNLLISMKNTSVIERAGKFIKDKTSESSKSKIPQEEATHFSDAIDKLIWTVYQTSYSRNSDFVDVRL